MSRTRLDNCLISRRPSSPPIRITDDASSSDESSLNSPSAGRLNPSAATLHPRAPRRAMRCFVPRPFPPPALANVPVEYIIDQLHSLAPHYWSKPETADCSIIVPLDGLFTKTGQASQSSGSMPDPFANLMPSTSASSSNGRRATDPIRPAPRMVMKLHMDYLSAHSTLLRGLFSGVSPLDLISSASPFSTPRGSSFHLPIASNPQHLSPKPSAARGLPIAPLMPRLLPSSPSHPTIYLPVPDPSSLRLLIHYMYFGSTSYIEDALDDGTVTWEGLARNVEFLGMGTEIKVCLGRWYGRWRRSVGRPPNEKMEVEEDDYTDSDDDSYIDSDDDDDMEASSSVTTMSVDDDCMDVEDSFKRAEIDAPRGRPRTQRRLGHAISDPGPIRGQRFRPAAHGSQSSSPSSKDRA